MSIFEYDKEKEEKKLRKAEYEAGWKDGENVGWNKGISQGIISKGREFGLSDAAIIEQLQTKLGISEADAKNYLKR